MGIEHENIHFETSSVLIRQYPVELVTKPAGWKYALTGIQIAYSLFKKILLAYFNLL